MQWTHPEMSGEIPPPLRAHQIRFDPVYVGHFKCNLRTIRHGYPHIHRYVRRPRAIPHLLTGLTRRGRWLRKLYWGADDTFRATTNFEHIKTHYYWSHPNVCRPVD